MGIAFGEVVDQKKNSLKRLILFIVFIRCALGTLCAQEPDSSATMLQAAIVKPRPNPAHRIIENAINNRGKNNPEKNGSYRCMVYHRMIFIAQVDSSVRRMTKPSNHPHLKPDTSGYNLIMESVVARTFVAPEQVEEKVIAAKTSGFKEYQQLSMLPSALQFFHFYNDRIEWKNLNLSFVNPISPHSTGKYFFLLQDTVISPRGDSTFVVYFQPSRRSNIEGLKGVIHINSNGWAIEKVIAEPATATLFSIRIEQQYSLIDAATWFPHSLSFEMVYKNYGFTGVDLACYSSSSISEVVIDPPVDERKVGAPSIWVAQDAHKHPEYIARYRLTPLSQKELNTYKKYERINYDWAMQIAEGAVDHNSFSVKIFDIPFNQVVNYNYYEGWRLGMGLYTNRRLSPWFSTGGYYRYGLKDKKSKYGASFSFFPAKDWDTEIKAWVQNDITGLSYSREAGIGGSSWLWNFYIGLQYKWQHFAPIFDYSFKGVSYDYRHGLRHGELGFQLRYAVQEQRSKMFRRTYAFRTDYPVFYLKYGVGIPGAPKSGHYYQRVELGVQFDRFFRNFGRTSFSVWGGSVSKEVPVMMLFNQSYLYRSIFFNQESKSKFNVIVNQIYAANQYINGFLYHDFGSLLYKMKSKVFRPRFAIAQSAGWSWLSAPSEHGGTPLYDMRKGYFETGIVIEDIIRLNWLNFCYAGLGGALYGSYGGSVESPFTQTLTPMIRLSFSF